MRTAEAVANYIIAYGLQIGHPTNNWKLQKILYYVQVHFLKKTGSPFFQDEIEAWQFGPVISKVYYEFAVFGPAPITIFKEQDISLTPEEQSDLNQIIQDKGVIPYFDMLEDTKRDGSPWQKCYKPEARNIITKEIMELYG